MERNFGLIWDESPTIVFYIGAVMAAISFALSLNIPNTPKAGNEVRLFKVND